ncbi:MAG: hypothetical protein EOO63_15485 [Hymenobacter sp.]|nr:MAG: hypothetical protein EOO63_15485 [Hymenobacter sp.]
MKTLLTVTGTLALAARLLTASAQTTPAATKATKTATQRAATYQGPKVVKDSKALGQKMVQKSKPTDMTVPPPVKVK